MITLDNLSVFFMFPHKHRPQNKQRIVVARVKENKEELFRVTAKRNISAGDKFDKYEGAKVAFAKALRRLNLTKDQRAEFWRRFFEYYPQAKF